MIIDIPANTAMWEMIAAISVLQGLQEFDPVAVHVIPPRLATGHWTDNTEVLSLASLTLTNVASPEKQRMEFADTYRRIDDATEPYSQMLAEYSGYPVVKPVLPRFPLVTPYAHGGIVVAPFGIKRELDIPIVVWQNVVKMLRSYGMTVYLIGDRHQRQNASAFTESEILCDLYIKDKLEALASAKLVVGVPNAWTWAAAAFDVSMVYFYPDNIPQRRWFSYSSQRFGRQVFTPNQIQVPVMLAGLRLLIESM